MLLAEVVEASARVASTRKRLEKIAALAAVLGRLEPREAPVGVAFLAGEIRQGRIGVGGAALRAALPEEPAAEPTLTLLEVDRALTDLARLGGPGSGNARLEGLRALLARGTAAEADFLTRLLFGELRQGALEGVMIEAIARAADLPSAGVRRAVMLCGSLGPPAVAALTEGAEGLARFRLEVFRPLHPMLAETAQDSSEALQRLGRAAFEWKLDGMRVQAHRSGERVRLFTRGLKEFVVPELVEAVRALPARELVLDGEILALRPDGTPHAFQTTMKRLGERKEPLSTFFFDVLHVDGETLLDLGLEERVAVLSRVIPPEMRVPRLVTADPAEAEAFVQDALDRGHEGVMAKALDAPYEAGARGATWLKIKLAHTLDLVVLAAEWGSGRRQGWLSNLHLGARDPETGGFVMLGKTFKGMTDEVLAWQTQRLQELEVSRDGFTVYVRPELVVEAAVSDVQTSPHYPGGMALRFARLKRYREDKSAEEADTIEAVRAIHRRTNH